MAVPACPQSHSNRLPWATHTSAPKSSSAWGWWLGRALMATKVWSAWAKRPLPVRAPVAVLPGKKVFRCVQIESKLESIARYEMAKQIPLAE